STLGLGEHPTIRATALGRPRRRRTRPPPLRREQAESTRARLRGNETESKRESKVARRFPAVGGGTGVLGIRECSFRDPVGNLIRIQECIDALPAPARRPFCGATRLSRPTPDR